MRVLIILITLGCCAFFLAQGSTQLIAATWMPARVTASKAAAPSSDLPAKGELPPDKTAILARNMFDPTTGPLWPPKTTIDPNAPAAGTVVTSTQQLADGQMPPPCEGP